MKPDVQKVMLNSFERILTDVAPHLTAEYAVGSASVIGLMMFQTATEFDRAAENRVQENAALRLIFSDAVPLVSDKSLKDRLQPAAGTSDPSLRISDLDKTNDELLAVLIDLQSHIETQPGPGARELEARIWSELARAAEARRLPHPMVG
jgi:hypothetical protein